MASNPKVRWFGVLLVGGLLAVCVSGASGQGPTFTVTSTDDVDDGTCNPAHCSLREAITAANGSQGEVLIAFDILGPGPHTIRPATPLPNIQVPVHINGTTEPDFAGTPIIELDGSLAGGTDGLSILASNSTVSGLVVNQFEVFGIWVSGGASGTIIEGCYLGTDVTGNVALGNSTAIGINGGTGHMVGGPAPNQRNVISGNRLGIHLANSTGNSVSGNYIGTNAAGDQAVPNDWGITVTSEDNVIGGEEPGEGNVVSGNEEIGINVRGMGNSIAGNMVGVDRTGTFSIGNGVGVNVASEGASDNTIGGFSPGARNIISGNQVGVLVDGVDGTLVIGNYIGTDQTGLMAVPNQTGLMIEGSTGTTVGGFTPGRGNLISGNSSSGIEISNAAASDNLIQGNLIGVGASGTANLGNGGAGILFEEGPSNNQIGGEDQGAGNIIAYNGGSGIALKSDAGAGNLIRGNSIFSNNGLGIDLQGLEGVDLNDEGDADTGPNQLLNYPLVMAVPAQGSILAKALMHNSLPNEPFTFEFFENDSCDPSGHGEGKTPLFTTMITSAADGDASMSGVTSGVTHLTATATDGSGNTSEFSECVALSDFDMGASPASTTVSAGSAASFSITLSALGGPFNDAVELECSGNPTGTTCTFLEPELIPGAGIVSTTMTVTTQGPGSASAPWTIPPDVWLVLAALLGLAVLGHRTLMWSRGGGAKVTATYAAPALLTAGILILVFQLGCGGGTTAPPVGGTDPGTYTLTITGTWETVSHSASATLVVN